MNLFMVDDLVGRGLPMFLPKGYVIWQELENYIKNKERKLGYLHVMTPCVGTVNLYKTSGHWDHYKDCLLYTSQPDTLELHYGGIAGTGCVWHPADDDGTAVHPPVV